MRSIDDKAYLRPGTSEGFCNTRNQKILTTTNIEKAGKLPKYDWPEKLLYQTPGAHRIFTKESCMSEEYNEEKLVTKDDSHFVFMRPKAIVESSGTTWASEKVRLRQRHPDLFEVQENCEAYSTEFRKACATIENACFLYDDMTETGDLSRAKAEQTCIYTEYECKRLQHLSMEINPYLSADEKMVEIEAENKILSGNVKRKLQDLSKMIDLCLGVANTKSKQQFQNRIKNVARCCRDTIAVVKNLKIPVFKARWCDLTDAGPRVGVSNFEVKFRDAELCRIFNSDHRIRFHKSRGDSGQGKAERANSAIGDAVVDGATIIWEVYKQFDGMNEEEITQTSVKDFEELEEQRMEKNAWHVAKTLVERIDGAPVLSERIKAYLTENKQKQFFHTTSTPVAKNGVPGAVYFEKIMKFFSDHYKVGELFTEFVRTGCEDEGCYFCHTWSGPPTTRVPQPVPDGQRPMHYMDVNVTPTHTESGEEREPDDWQPRANITKLFNEGSISLDQQESVTEFSEKFYVKREFVANYFQHLTDLRRTKDIRAR